MKKMVKGELTAFLSLIFLLLLALVGAVLESASIQILKNEKRADAGRATESVFAEYQKELLEQYEVFALEGTYESGTMSEDAVLNRLSFYGAENMQITIEAVRYLTDENGRPFYRQAVEYEKEKTGAAALGDLTGNLPLWQDQEQQTEEYGKENTETSVELEQMLQDEEQGLPQEDNPLEVVSQVRAGGLLNIVLPEGFDLSQKKIELSDTVSHRSLKKGYGSLKAPEDSGADAIFFNLYLADKFGNALEQRGDTALAYEMEYLLSGKQDDAENLEESAKKLCAVRCAANYAYLLTDTTKQAEAEVLAGTLCTLLTVPGITAVVKHALLLAWAYGEAIVDVRTLLAGKKVPLVKTAGTWQISLTGLMNLKDTVSVQEGTGTDAGFSYGQYLQALLLMRGKEELSMRALDLVEQNMKTVYGQTYFLADNCLTGTLFRIICPMRRGIQYEFETVYQYH